MRNVLRLVIRFNEIWITIFFLFQLYMMISLRYDGKWNKPMSESEYIDNGGGSFDYYAGYAYLTVNNTVNYKMSDKTKISITDKSYVRYLYIILYSLIWIYGLYSLYKIQVDRYPTEKDLEQAKTDGEGIQKASARHYVFGFITTVISIYGVEYSILYMNHFWLK